jgi:hypothetical protein
MALRRSRVRISLGPHEHTQGFILECDLTRQISFEKAAGVVDYPSAIQEDRVKAWKSVFGTHQIELACNRCCVGETSSHHRSCPLAHTRAA